MSPSTIAWESETVHVAGIALHLTRGGRGAPLLVLHHDVGSPEHLAFYDALAQHFTVLRPAHPGYDRSSRPEWMRSVRDVAVVYQALLAGREDTREPGRVALLGLGFGGWIAAEMATMAPRQFRRLVLVGAMGIKPERGDIADQALVSYIDYVRLGFADQRAFDAIYGAEPPTATLEQWDLNREMSFRIAWKPYMYSPTLPHLLGGVATPALVVWGREDRIVPLECGERYAKALGQAKLEIVDGAGHFVEMEKPEALASLVTRFLTQA
ncbi:MAG TPA: alpha/beta hydrolase [Methylomirabilota bacterium]|jgi:pimeloyl-ACP methyl ester carboxylesterase|nr:alpha/beta hydrolase [Methylomirabilota bacterium]